MKFKFIIFAGIFAFLATASAQAQTPWYLGVKAGLMNADVSGFDDATNIGLLLGYNFFDDNRGAFAIEGEFTTTIDKGDVRIGSATGDWEVDTWAIYAAFRTAGPAYVKAKAGYLDEDVSVGVAGTGVSGSDSGFSFGAGFGFRMGQKTSLEFEYTVIEEDIDFISLGLNTHF